MRKRKPLQIHLERAQFDSLKALAESRGVTLSDVVRESLAKYLAETQIESDPAMKLVGLGSSGTSSLGSEHDEHLAEAAAS